MDKNKIVSCDFENINSFPVEL